jgi:hypothetical protein
MARRTTFVHVKHLAVAATAALALAFGVTPIARHVLAAPPPAGDDLSRELDRIREVTRKFKDLEKAHEAGYPTRVPRCIDSQDGGMGHHYMHPRLLDDTLELEKPEILVYAPVEDGKLRLAGVEYIVPLSAWRDTDPPKILGQSLKRSDQLEIWYLHVWVWEENVNGMFADWNPAVKCPAATM